MVWRGSVLRLAPWGLISGVPLGHKIYTEHRRLDNLRFQLFSNDVLHLTSYSMPLFWSEPKNRTIHLCIISHINTWEKKESGALTIVPGMSKDNPRSCLESPLKSIPSLDDLDSLCIR
jgi:hypothetical protein